jgi:hypothetical protein
VEFLILVAGITAAAAALGLRIPEGRKVKRTLSLAKIQSIDSLADGKAVVVRGTVALIDRAAYIVAPWTRQHCVYWRIVFDEVGIGGDFVELGRVDGGTPFLLRSKHGSARVVPDRPRIALHGQSFSRSFHEAGAFIEIAGGKLKRPNYPNTSWLRMTVYALEPDAVVTISGWCTREPDPEASDAVTGYREQLPTRPVISGTRRAKLLIG